MITNTFSRSLFALQTMIVAGGMLLMPFAAIATNVPEAETEPVETSCELEASADVVDFGGSITLDWETAGYENVTVHGEAVAANGSMIINNITDNTSYVLVATNEAGQRCNTEVDVTVEFPAEEAEEADVVEDTKVPYCELVVEKSADRATAVPGDHITYTIHVENIGTANCTGGGVKIFDHLSDQLEFVSFTTSNNVQPGYYPYPVYDKSINHTVRFNGSTLEPGELAEMTVTAKIKTPEHCGDFVVENAAKATARELNNFGNWTFSNTVKTTVDNDCEVPEVPGCTDVAATNYNAAATEDDGSCEYPETPTPTCEFYPTAAAIVVGESTELNWTTAHANRVVLSGGAGEVALSGSLQVAPLATYQYLLTAFGDDDTKVECETTITVTTVDVPGCTDTAATNYNVTATIDDGSCEYPEPEVPGCTDADATNYNASATTDDGSCTYRTSTGGGGSASPRCELEISDTKITAGERVTLTWETRSTREITLKDDRGNVLVTTDTVLAAEKDELLDGEITVTPTRDTEYTLIAERGSRDRECRVEVEVEDTIVVLETRDQAPLVAGISLAEVPYTGFEAGPIMTALFYTLLIVWSLYLTYVFVVPKTVAVTTTSNTRLSASEQMKAAEAIRPDVFAPVTMTAPVVASTAATVAPAPANLPIAPVAPVAPTMPAIATAKTPVEVAALEAIAHNNQALLSSDAITTFIAAVPVSDQLTKIMEVITDAKAQFPLEDGWVVINNDRMLSLLVA